MNNDLIYEELREAITKDFNDLKLMFNENGLTFSLFKRLFRDELEEDFTNEYYFLKDHLIDRIQKNIKNLQNYLKGE